MIGSEEPRPELENMYSGCDLKFELTCMLWHRQTSYRGGRTAAAVVARPRWLLVRSPMRQLRIYSSFSVKALHHL